MSRWQDAARNIDDRNRDKFGLVTYLRKNGFRDGGDTCQMTAFYYYGILLYGKPDLIRFTIDLAKLTVRPGIFVRHPNRPVRWNEPGMRDFARWNDPKVLSRDQLLPLCIAMGAHGMSIAPTLKRIAGRGFCSQNGDPIWLHHFAACFIRAPRLSVAYPILWFTDIFLVTGAIIDVIRAYTQPNNNKGYKNALMLLLQAYHCMPTPISWLARKVYRLRPGGLEAGVNAAFASNDDPMFEVLFREMITRVS